ncbi:MAG: lysophospholipase [Micrococcales bacterium 73-15]|uniref:ABC transporter permease n=1 Tax=Salana multivorans TaxID=120377 RepID=UPI0009649769|nr:ABC transporter permease [Salana multivorans]OJX93828.1 MAG: lysophospholipase [Micrococcales bacterium 73-15]
MLKVALRGIRAHLVRFLMSLLAVALGVAFVAGSFALRAMLSGTFDQIVDASTPADVYVRVAPQGSGDGGDPDAADGGSGDAGGSGMAALAGAAAPVPPEAQTVVEAVQGVAQVLPEVQGSLVLVGADGTAVAAAGGAPTYGLAYYPDDPATRIVAGRAPTGDAEIALESGGLAVSGLAVGDTTTIVVAGDVREVTVVGEIAYDTPAAGTTLVLFPADVALAAFGPLGPAQLAIYAADDVDPETLAADVGDALASAQAAGTVPASDLEAVTGEQLRQESKDAIGEVLGFITTFLLVFAAIALFVGAFIISNTFAMSVRQRMKEFAMLRAVGASPTQVFVSILVQAAVVGLVGSAFGLAGGLALVEGLQAFLAAMGMELGGSVPVDAPTVVVSVLVGTVVSVVAAAVPARRAALVPPVEAMREEVTTTDASLVPRSVVGGVLVALGVAAVALATADPGRAQVGWWLGAGAGGVLVGVLLLAPVLVRAALGWLAWPFAVAVRPMGGLARGNVTRNPRRTANTAGALMIGMALVGAASVIATSTQASVADIVAEQTDADLIVTSASGGVPDGVADAVAAVPGVGRVDEVRYAQAELRDAAGASLTDGPGPGLVVALGPGTLGTTLLVDVVDGDPDAALAAGEAVVNRSIAPDLEVGDTVDVVGATRLTLTVGAVIDGSVPRGPVTVSREVLDEIAPPAAQVVDSLFVQAADDDLDADGLARLQDDVKAAVVPFVVVSVLTSDEFVSQLSSQVDQVLAILYALLGLSIVIAVLGIVNTLALSVIERTREIGLLRAVGLGRLQLSVTIVIESVLTAVFGTAVGLVIGVGLAATLPTIYADQGLSELAIGWANLALMLLVAVVVGVLAAVWPAVRASRLKVLDAVSYE